MSEDLNFGRRIKELRDLKGWTQAELSERAEISRSYLGEIERGEKQPTAVLLKKIGDALMVPMDMFFDDTRLVPLAVFEDKFPEDVRLFLRDREGLPYLELAVKARDFQISPELLSQLINAIRADKAGVEKSR